jgi:hypothetical protein
MYGHGVSFSIARHAAWAPGLTTAEEWADWALAPFVIQAGVEAGVKMMPPMLRRRAGALGKMALEVAYQCLDGRRDVPSVFCSRHGDVARAVELLTDLTRGETLSPTAFGMAVHNATAGLLTIARADRASHIAVAAGDASVEHAVIEACGLLADGAPMVLLVACDFPLPEMFAAFDDCQEQPYAWAWLMVPAADDAISLRWRSCGVDEDDGAGAAELALSGGLEVLRFQAGGVRRMERSAERRRWCWSRDG